VDQLLLLTVNKQVYIQVNLLPSDVNKKFHMTTNNDESTERLAGTLIVYFNKRLQRQAKKRTL